MQQTSSYFYRGEMNHEQFYEIYGIKDILSETLVRLQTDFLKNIQPDYSETGILNIEKEYSTGNNWKTMDRFLK